MADFRKNLIIIIFLLTGTIITLLFLNLSSSWKKQPAEILDSSSNPANLPKKISKGLVSFFELNGSNKVVFYEKSDSTVYETDLDGKNKKELARIPGVLKIVFSPLGHELIAAVSAEKNTLKNYYFDLKNNKRTALPKDAERIIFSSDGGKIAYYFYDGEAGEGEILTANPDGSDSKTIFRTRIKNLNLIWPQNDLIVFYLKEKDNQSLFFSIRPNGKEFQRISQEEYNSYSKDDSKKTSRLKDFIIFLNAEDGRLYSLKL